MRHKSRRNKAIISYILSFILMLLLMFISLLTLGKYSMLSERGVMHSCDRIEYYDDMCEEMKSEAYYMGIPYGIEKKCLKKVFTSKQVRKDMLKVLEAQISEEKVIVNTEHVREKIKANVVKQNGELTENQQQSLDAYIVEVEKMYQKKMTIPGSDYIVKAIRMSTEVALIGVPVAVLIAILCSFLLISMRRSAYRGLRFVIYGILGAGITLVTVFAAMISKGFIYRFNISNAYMRKFFTYYIGHGMLMQVFVGIGLLLAGAILIYVVTRQKFRVRV